MSLSLRLFLLACMVPVALLFVSCVFVAGLNKLNGNQYSFHESTEISLLGLSLKFVDENIPSLGWSIVGLAAIVLVICAILKVPTQS